MLSTGNIRINVANNFNNKFCFLSPRNLTFRSSCMTDNTSIQRVCMLYMPTMCRKIKKKVNVKRADKAYSLKFQHTMYGHMKKTDTALTTGKAYGIYHITKLCVHSGTV